MNLFNHVKQYIFISTTQKQFLFQLTDKNEILKILSMMMALQAKKEALASSQSWSQSFEGQESHAERCPDTWIHRHTRRSAHHPPTNGLSFQRSSTFWKPKTLKLRRQHKYSWKNTPQRTTTVTSSSFFCPPISHKRQTTTHMYSSWMLMRSSTRWNRLRAALWHWCCHSQTLIRPDGEKKAYVPLAPD